MKYDSSTGQVSLLINAIGPGDEGEYTCTAVNKFGEAICTVYIQPEGKQNYSLNSFNSFGCRELNFLRINLTNLTVGN